MNRTFWGNKLGVIITGSALVAMLGIAGVASAQTTGTAPAPQGNARGMWGSSRGQMPRVFGAVTANDGTTLTVTSKAGPNGTPAAATYTVN